MGLSCRCCKKKGKCLCKACPTIASESLDIEIDYREINEKGEPYDEREDVINVPIYGPEPPYPEAYEIQSTCGYSRSQETSDLERGVNGCGKPYPPLDEPLPCGEFAAEMIDPTTGESLGYQVGCPEGYTCVGDKVQGVRAGGSEVGFCEPITDPGDISKHPECSFKYDMYTCQANGPRMARVGPAKESTFFGVGLSPTISIDGAVYQSHRIECTEGGACPQGYTCVESTDPPKQIGPPKLVPPVPCKEDGDCDSGYECDCLTCEPIKVDAPIQSFCELEKTPCGSTLKPCPEGYECVTVKVLGDPDKSESFCEPINPEITKEFLDHPIQAQFGLYPCKNPHKNEQCAPLTQPIPCDKRACPPLVGKLPEQCEECTDTACQDHFGPGYKCNHDGDCQEKTDDPCPQGYDCMPDPSNPLVKDFPSSVQPMVGIFESWPDEDYCTDDQCLKLYGPGFKCDSYDAMGVCVIDPEDGTDTNCELLFGEGYEYYPTKPILDTNGNKVVYDVNDPNAPSCEQLTGNPDSIEEDGECHEIVPNCQKIPTNCLPEEIETQEEPDWIFVENTGLPVFLVPIDGLPHGPLPLSAPKLRVPESCSKDVDCSPGYECRDDRCQPILFGTRKRRHDPARINARHSCGEIDVNNGECTPECCHETFGDPWLPNHEWTCKRRTISIKPLEKPVTCSEDVDCPEGYECGGDGNCVPANLLPELDTPQGCDPDNDTCPDGYECVGGLCKPKAIANPDAGFSCYLEPIDFYNNSKNDLNPVFRELPTLQEFECPQINQACKPELDPNDPARSCSETKPCPDGYECIDGQCEVEKPCPPDYVCIDGHCEYDCEAKYGLGATCEEGYCQPPCSDKKCVEKYGAGFHCNTDINDDNYGRCQAITNRNLDARIPRSIGETCYAKSKYSPDDTDGDRFYFGHTSLWGGSNDRDFGVGVYNLDTTKIRTRLYLDYGYHLHYPFDKGHIGTELTPTGCAVEVNNKTDVWRYKGNKGHRIPYPKVNTIAIGNRYPSAHSFLDDEEDVDDFVKIGSGPYFAEYCDRAVGTEEPGGLQGLGDPAPTNWNPFGNPQVEMSIDDEEEEDGTLSYTPFHENDDYNPKDDPFGIIKACDPAFVVPCDKNPQGGINFDYLDYVRTSDMRDEDGLNRTGLCQKDLEDWRSSNHSVFSHCGVPSGPVGGLIIDRVDFIPVKYHFPAHTMSPDMWLYPGMTEYGPSVAMLFGNDKILKNNRVLVPAVTTEVYMAVYYNKKIGRKAVRYDELPIDQFVPPPNGWLENIWQLGDIANPLDVENIQEYGSIAYSRPVNGSRLDPSARGPMYFKKGYKYAAMGGAKYIEKYGHLPKDRAWDMPTPEGCTGQLPPTSSTCTDVIPLSRWTESLTPCSDESDCDDGEGQCVCEGDLPWIRDPKIGDPDGPLWTAPEYGRSPKPGTPSRCDNGTGKCWYPPIDFEGDGQPLICTNEKCEEMFEEGVRQFDTITCDEDPFYGNCVVRACPVGYECSDPDPNNLIVHEVDGKCDKQLRTNDQPTTNELDFNAFGCDDDKCEKQFGRGWRCASEAPPGSKLTADHYCEGPRLGGICDQFGKGYTCYDGTIAPVDPNHPLEHLCGEDSQSQEDADQYCVDKFGPGFTCSGDDRQQGVGVVVAGLVSVQVFDPLTAKIIVDNNLLDLFSGACIGPSTCEKEVRPCIAPDPCEDTTCEDTLNLQTCGDANWVDGQNTKPTGDAKLTKHLYDFWNHGEPFPSNNGDVTDSQLTWFKADLDPYGEIQLKPWINPEERDIHTKYPEINLLGEPAPPELAKDTPCEEGCPDGYYCEKDSKLCVPKRSTTVSDVTYGPLLYSSTKSGGYRTCAGIKNQMGLEDKTETGPESKPNMDRAIRQWWFEQPYHLDMPVSTYPSNDLNWSMMAYAYSRYLAQIGLGLNYHTYDDDWARVGTMTEEEILEHFRSNKGPDYSTDDPYANIKEVPYEVQDDFDQYKFKRKVDVREVYRMLKDPYRWSDEYKQWVVNNDKFGGGPGAGGYMIVNGVPVGGPGQIPHSNRSLVGQPTGSYHGRDGMIRYNIHPWAEIYQQLRITDALLEMGRDFHEVQQVLSSLEIECNTGIFKNNTPTIVEPFGYNETGNIQFQLNQPHGSHLAELISPRIINYRPTGLIPPGNAPGIKIGGPGHAFCIYEYHYPFTGTANMPHIFMPDGTLYGLGQEQRGPKQPFVCGVLTSPQTYPSAAHSRGESATPEEEDFTVNIGADGNRSGGINTFWGEAEFYMAQPYRDISMDDPTIPLARRIEARLVLDNFASTTQYLLHDGTLIRGKVYGASKWPWHDINSHIAGSQINGESYGMNFYVGGHGYFDPDDLKAKGLQNLDPDKGLFTYCFIAGMSDNVKLPGLPDSYTFGMVGASFSGFFHHLNTLSNAPYGYRGDWTYPTIRLPGTTQGRGFSTVLADKHTRHLQDPVFKSHYFDVYDYPGQPDDLVEGRGLAAPNISVEYQVDREILLGTILTPEQEAAEFGLWKWTGTIMGGTYTRPNGEEIPFDGRPNQHLKGHVGRAIVKDFMAKYMNEEFLKQYYYAQICVVREGPRAIEVAAPAGYEGTVFLNNEMFLPVSRFIDTNESFSQDVNLILKREDDPHSTDSGRLIEGMRSGPLLQDLPDDVRYYKTAKYQRMDWEECVDTYDKECAIGGSSPCGSPGNEPVILYTLAPDESCEDCINHIDDFSIKTDDFMCVQGETAPAYCGRDADGNPHTSAAQANQYCVDLYGPGYTCSGGAGLDALTCVGPNGETPTVQITPSTCQMPGLLPAHTDALYNGVIDLVYFVHKSHPSYNGLENILGTALLNNYFIFSDSDEDTNYSAVVYDQFRDTRVVGVHDERLYWLAHNYGSHGCIAPNGDVITDKFLRDLAPEFFYREINGVRYPLRVSLYGAVLDFYEYDNEFKKVFFSVGQPDIRPDFAKQEYICARMTDPETGIWNGSLLKDGMTIKHDAWRDPDTGEYKLGASDCVKTSRFYSGERSDFIPVYGQRSWPMHFAVNTPPAFTGNYGDPTDMDMLGATPFHWPWAVGDVCVDWSTGSPRRNTGTTGSGVDGRCGLNYINASGNVMKYWAETIEEYGPEDWWDEERHEMNFERIVRHGEFPNTLEAELYKLGIISGTTNTGDMLFFSDSHRQINDILQAKPPCQLWTSIYDFKWPLTPATGVNTPQSNACPRIITPPGTPVVDPDDLPPTNNSKINISEKPILRFKSGGSSPQVLETPKLWFHTDSDNCKDTAEEKPYLDPPVPCDPNADCDDGYECREIEGCDTTKGQTFCLPEKCEIQVFEKSLKEYRKDLGFDYLVLQPVNNPKMKDHVLCPIDHVTIPHWGPRVQIKSALFNRDLITREECSTCDTNCDCEDLNICDPDNPCPEPDLYECIDGRCEQIKLNPEQLCERWSGDEECPDGYDCTQHKCLSPTSEKCFKVDAYGCRKCMAIQLPTITITAPTDYSELVLDPDADDRERDDSIRCDSTFPMNWNNSYNPPSADGDVDCKRRFTSSLDYSNFREAHPELTVDNIFADGDECVYQPACPEGYECRNNGCDPIREEFVPAVKGVVDFTVNFAGGTGQGSGDVDEGTLVDLPVRKVVLRITKLNSNPDSPGYLEPLKNSLQTIEYVEDLTDTLTLKWDTQRITTGYTPKGFFQIEAEVFDESGSQGYDIIYVRVAKGDNDNVNPDTVSGDVAVTFDEDKGLTYVTGIDLSQIPQAAIKF